MQNGSWSDRIPTLATPRLILRAFRQEDTGEYAELCADPEVMRYLGDGSTFDRQGAWRQMAMILGHWQLRGFGLWAVQEKTSGLLLGRIGIHQPEGWPGIEVGWVLVRKWWGKGFATEGAAAAIGYAFDTLGLDHIISLIHPDNHNSIRVAERLGEQLEGETELWGHRVLIYGKDRG